MRRGRSDVGGKTDQKSRNFSKPAADIRRRQRVEGEVVTNPRNPSRILPNSPAKIRETTRELSKRAEAQAQKEVELEAKAEELPEPFVYPRLRDPGAIIEPQPYFVDKRNSSLENSNLQNLLTKYVPLSPVLSDAGERSLQNVSNSSISGVNKGFVLKSLKENAVVVCSVLEKFKKHLEPPFEYTADQKKVYSPKYNLAKVGANNFDSFINACVEGNVSDPIILLDQLIELKSSKTSQNQKNKLVLNIRKHGFQDLDPNSIGVMENFSLDMCQFIRDF